MKPELTNQQALIALYNASKQAPLKADEHEFLKTCALQLEKFINPEVKEDKKK